MITTPPPGIRVLFAVDDDEQATKIAAMLEALGYEVVRSRVESVDVQAWALDDLARSIGLTEREREVMRELVDGEPPAAIAAALEITRATVKWHLHNIYAKAKVKGAAELLRLILRRLPIAPLVAEPELSPPHTGTTPRAKARGAFSSGGDSA